MAEERVPSSNAVVGVKATFRVQGQTVHQFESSGKKDSTPAAAAAAVVGEGVRAGVCTMGIDWQVIMFTLVLAACGAKAQSSTNSTNSSGSSSIPPAPLISMRYRGSQARSKRLDKE